ncbi:MAG: ATP-binding protein [Lachnospiraceae bacterium]
MRRTFFDKITLFIVALVIVIFIALAGYMTYATQNALIAEKQNTLTREAILLSNQAISPYLQGKTTLLELQERLNEFEATLQSSIWFYSPEGELIAASYGESGIKRSLIPKTIEKLEDDIDLRKGFVQVGTFYDLFDSQMISIGIPIYNEETLVGYMMLHTSQKEIDTLKDDIENIMYMPLFVTLLIVGIVLAYLSGSILRPIGKINSAAREFAKGNFDAKTGVSRNDEIGELSDSLEYMAKELSKLDEYRKNFIANISHDFRSPLTSIKGYLEAMLDGTIPVEKYDKYLNIVLNESKRLTKLTSGLLELNDFDTYGPILKRTRFDVVDVIRATRNTVEGQCDAKKIDFRINCPASDTMVYADKMKIGQVIYNLVDNAIKFTPKNGNITITVTEKNDKVFISVKDSGPGIEKDKQNRVFERFYKTDSSRGKDKQGTGLGLSIVKEIVKAHGEHINLISTEGAGSEFTFSLPKNEENSQIIGRKGE